MDESLLPLHRRMDALQHVPSFAYEKEAAELINRDLYYTRCSIGDFCGLAHLLARRAALLFYSGAIFKYAWSIYTYRGLSCTDNDFNDRVVKAVGITVVGFYGYLEFKCVKWLILPWQQRTTQFTICFLPCWNVSYWVWVSFNHSMSLLSQVTLQANAHLAGNMIACHHATPHENFCALILTIGMVLIFMLTIISAIQTVPFHWSWMKKVTRLLREMNTATVGGRQ